MKMLCQVLFLNGGKYKNDVNQIKRSGDEYVWKNVSEVREFVKQW